MQRKVLTRHFYLQSTEQIARELLGKQLVLRQPKGEKRLTIVETEAYLGATDRASHAYGGRRTPRIQPMFLMGGHTYVYFIYGMYYCFNIVTGRVGVPEAVLIRALHDESEASPSRRYAGPGKLCRELSITKQHNGLDLVRDETMFIASTSSAAPEKIIACPRIGVATYGKKAATAKLRFYIKDHPAVSKYR